ncbi:MAG TPA: hypothetical protein VKG02_05045 [Blastocatellia bacterium]|nr:hypothetical protein [Blastocatellia bacterium]
MPIALHADQDSDLDVNCAAVAADVLLMAMVEQITREVSFDEDTSLEGAK